MTKIIGIVLVKNEDLFIQQALQNILDFCDEIIVLDNNSTDATFGILEEIKKTSPQKIQLHKISNIKLSHRYIEQYANTDTWIFAVDGDEIYDKAGLHKLKEEIISGTYNNYWKIFGNCIHVTKINQDKSQVFGYLAPPSRSITKLYNFNLIKDWKEYTERLHGTKMNFKDGCNENQALLLHDLYDWDKSHFKCLHMCFLKRSSADLFKVSTRFNPLENTKFYFPFVNFLRNITKGKFSLQSSYKLEKYKRGKITELNSTLFFT
jgi:glycosyltransferase involved in cell wall biosynthesis